MSMEFSCKTQAVSRRLKVRALAHAAAIASLLYGSTASQSASIKLENLNGLSSSVVAHIRGEIKRGDDKRFKKLVKGKHVERVELSSNGGRIGPAIKIGAYIRSLPEKVITVVRANRKCLSACMLIFAAGKEMRAERSAILGVHQVFEEKTGKATVEANAWVARYLIELGMPPVVITTFASAKPKQMTRITSGNATKLGFGAIVFGPIPRYASVPKPRSKPTRIHRPSQEELILDAIRYPNSERQVKVETASKGDFQLNNNDPKHGKVDTDKQSEGKSIYDRILSNTEKKLHNTPNSQPELKQNVVTSTSQQGRKLFYDRIPKTNTKFMGDRIPSTKN